MQGNARTWPRKRADPLDTRIRSARSSNRARVYRPFFPIFAVAAGYGDALDPFSERDTMKLD